MANVFQDIGHGLEFTGKDVIKGFEWIGKEVEMLPSEVEKVVTVTEDLRADADTLCPEAVTLITDSTTLASAAAKDGGAAMKAFVVLTTAITEAFAAGITNIPTDIAVGTSFEAFVQACIAHGTWADVVAAWQKTISDAGQFGSSAKAALQKLEADIQ